MIEECFEQPFCLRTAFQRVISVSASSLIMSVPSSPGYNESSGGSDLMALLDRELETNATDAEAGEQDDAISAAYTCAE